MNKPFGNSDQLPPRANDSDQAALDAASAVMELVERPLPEGGAVQRKAQVQCVIAGAIAVASRAAPVQSPSYEALQIIVQSVARALERAGIADCDDPGEAIDLLRECWQANAPYTQDGAQAIYQVKLSDVPGWHDASRAGYELAVEQGRANRILHTMPTPAAQGGREAVPLVQKTAPERIFLCVADDEFCRDEAFPRPWGEDLCWSADQPVRVCVPYVRVDLTPTPAAQPSDAYALLETWLGTWADSIPDSAYRSLLTIQFATRTPATAAQPSDAVRAAYGEVIKALAGMATIDRTDEQCDADVVPRDALVRLIHKARAGADAMRAALSSTPAAVGVGAVMRLVDMVGHTDATVDAMQDRMAALGFVVPVRVVSEGFIAAIAAEQGDAR